MAFGFLKELVSSLREGVQEGLDEARQELQEEQEAAEQTIDFSAVTWRERFSVALSAPYKEIYAPSLRRHSEEQIAKFLQTLELAEADKKGYADVLERDFEVVDAESVYRNAETFWQELQEGTGYAQIFWALKEAGLLGSDIKEAVKHLPRGYAKRSIEAVLSSHAEIGLHERSGDGFRIAVLAHIICGGAALGYISEQEALETMQPVVDHALGLFESWERYAESFLAGEKAWGYSNIMARKIIDGSVKRLLEHPASAWQHLNWAEPAPPL